MSTFTVLPSDLGMYPRESVGTNYQKKLYGLPPKMAEYYLPAGGIATKIAESVGKPRVNLVKRQLLLGGFDYGLGQEVTLLRARKESNPNPLFGLADQGVEAPHKQYPCRCYL